MTLKGWATCVTSLPPPSGRHLAPLIRDSQFPGVWLGFLRTFKRSSLRLEHSNLQIPNRAEVLRVAGAKPQTVLGGRGGHEGVSRPQAVREGVLFDVHSRPVTNVLGEGKRGKPEGLQEGLRRFMLPLVLSTLQQLQVRLQREKAFLFLLNKPRGLAVSPLNPDKEVGVKDHGAGPRAVAP